MNRASLEKLIEIVLQESNNPESELHGEQHWRTVCFVGNRLARDTEGADNMVVLLFGVLHDTRRENEGCDPDHGPRAADYAQELFERGLLSLSRGQLELLKLACETHTSALTTDDPTLGACYDADRLNLWRVGIVPDENYLSTLLGKKAAESEWTRSLHEMPLTWESVLSDYLRFAT